MTGTIKTLTLAMAFSLVAAFPNSLAATNKRQTAPCIVNTVTSPISDAQVQASILQWNNDVNNVNNFLNDVAAGTIGSFAPDELSQATSDALTAASDEPCQLMTLDNFGQQAGIETSGSAYSCAVGDLNTVFKLHVLDNLQKIIDDPSDAATVSSAVLDVNNFRCCNVLPDASILWLAAADSAGVSGSVTTQAPVENACSSIICTLSCGATVA